MQFALKLITLKSSRLKRNTDHGFIGCIIGSNIFRPEPGPTQTNMVASFTGLKSSAAFPVTRNINFDITSLASNGGKVHCMQVWPPVGKKKSRLSLVPPRPERQSLAKEVDYLIRSAISGFLEFEFMEVTFRDSTVLCTVSTISHRGTTTDVTGQCGQWKLPLFGCSDSSQVLKEVKECKKEYPNAFIGIIGFDNSRQVQCITFIAYKPPHF